MWICLKNSFLSVVADRENKERLLVRARRTGQIERVFPAAKVLANAGKDLKGAYSNALEMVQGKGVDFTNERVSRI